MQNLGRSYFGLVILLIFLTGAGLFLTYQAMLDTTGWPVPPLAYWQDRGSSWEIQALGLSYSVDKETVRIDSLVQRAQGWGEKIVRLLSGE